MQKTTESDTKILKAIVSFVASDVGKLDNGRWDELGDCILSLTNSDPLRAFSVFLELPPLYGKFIDRFLDKFLKEVHMILLHPDKDEDWTLALETAIKMGIQLLDSEKKISKARDILGIVLKSADELVRNGKEHFLQRAIQHLDKFLAKEGKFCKWTANQCGFLSEFVFKIAGIGTQSKETAKKIYQKVTELKNYVEYSSLKLCPSHVEKQESDSGLDKNLKMLSSVEIMKMVAGTQMDDMCREIAIRRVHEFLCDHTLRKVEMKVSEIKELQPLLISCLEKVVMPENTFKILGQVVFHVAHEIFGVLDEEWFELWEYIASQCKIEFKRTVYIFQSLTMMVRDKQFLIPAIENLLPEIMKNLNPPRELLVDNSSWILAFTGAFCSSIHLLDITSYTGYVKEIADKMIDSASELVERGMEVALVRRAFRDLESIVKKQLEWYGGCEYRSVKGLIWSLYAIKGMKMESKIVLRRINGIIERGTVKRVSLIG